jgi:hypothetical protein
MKNLRSITTRGIVTLGVLGLAFGLSAKQADAAPITFTVDESAITGALPNTFQASGLTAKYLEDLNLDANGAGTWTATLVVEFTDYTLGAPVSSQVAPADGEDPAEPNLYSLYALVTAEGTYTVGAGGPPGSIEYNFFPTASTADLYSDPNRDTTKDHSTLATANDGDDQHILNATNLDPSQSFGSVTILANGTVVGGFYSLFYNDVTLINPTGPLYLPTLDGLVLAAIATGDVDRSDEGSSFPNAIRGDTSIAFLAAPEPASMALFGLALLGSGIAARRRRTE